MSPVRTVYVPWVSPQPGFSQRLESQPGQDTEDTEDTDRGPPQAPGDKRGNKRSAVKSEKPRYVLKVKLPKYNQEKTKEDKTRRRRTIKTNTTVSTGGGGAQSAGTDSVSGGGDVFCFSQGPTGKATSEREKAKLAVLRTISKVLEENQLIRERLEALSRADGSRTD